MGGDSSDRSQDTRGRTFVGFLHAARGRKIGSREARAARGFKASWDVSGHFIGSAHVENHSATPICGHACSSEKGRNSFSLHLSRRFTLKRYVQKQWEKEAENRAAAKQAASSALPPAMQHFETHDGEVRRAMERRRLFHLLFGPRTFPLATAALTHVVAWDTDQMGVLFSSRLRSDIVCSGVRSTTVPADSTERTARTSGGTML